LNQNRRQARLRRAFKFPPLAFRKLEMVMRIGILGRRRALTGMLLVLLAPGGMFAADKTTAGSARISDRSAARPASGIQPAGWLRSSSAPCDGANCPTDGTAAGSSCYGPGGYCRGMGWSDRWALHCARKQACLAGYYGRPLPYPPGVPVQRVNNIYQQYWPTDWTGQPVTGGAVPQYPMVYQPTDTTQLGFYYKQVPYWYFRPEMLPTPPVPYWPVGMGTCVRGCLPGYGVPVGGAPVVNGGVVNGRVVNGGVIDVQPAAPVAAPAAPAPVPAADPVIVPEPEANADSRTVN
jgi:hypothetical protein